MRINAVFVGPTESMGYKPGEEYELTVKGMTIYPAVSLGKPCPYSSIESFLRNWEILEIER